MGKHDIISILEQHATEFHSVVPFDASKDRLLQFDFTERNNIDDDVVNDTGKFTHFINMKLQEARARYGIGGYAELRNLYRRSRVFDAPDGGEPRRFHLGTDIWGKPYTHVHAPIDGLIHSFGFNDGFGNYGATVILTHKLDGISFHTLYGHLSRSSLLNLHEGLRVEKGDLFAEFGIPMDNGQWPPHLHFQIIIDLEGMKGDYPGVCRYSERSTYLANCPDPDLILQLNKYLPY